MKKNRILVIAPHMDDEVLGCGGVIQKHKDEGDKVYVIFVACRVYNHRFNGLKNNIQKKHALAAKKIIKYDEAYFLDLSDERLDASVQDIIIPLEKYLEEIKPGTAYIPFRGDNNQDHRAVFDAARVVLRPAAASFIKHIYMYEVPSSTEQSPPLLENAFLPNHYADIGPYLEKKVKAMLCYESERRRSPNPRSPESLKALAGKRGSESGLKFAEAFMILRSLWK